MNEQEKAIFQEHISKFSTKQLIGWLSAISFISPLPEVSIDLNVKMHDMFYIIESEFMKKINQENSIDDILLDVYRGEII